MAESGLRPASPAWFWTKKRRRVTWLTPNAYLFSILLPIAAALMLPWLAELDHPPAGSPVQVVVTGDPGLPPTEFVEDVNALVAEHSNAIARFSTGLEDPSRRVLQLAVSEDSSFGGYLTDGYPRILFAAVTSVVPFEGQSLQNAAGRYLVYDSPGSARQLTLLAQEHGYGAETQDVTRMAMLLFKRSLLYSVIACGLLRVTAITSSTFSRARRYAIMRIWGLSAHTVLLRELRQAWRYLWKRMLTIGLITAATFVLLRRSQGIIPVGSIAAPIMLLTVAASLLAHSASLGLAYFMPDALSAIRGRVQRLPVMSLSYAIRIPVCFLLVMSSGSLINTVSNVKDIQGVLAGLTPAGKAQRLAISELQAPQADEQEAIFTGETLRTFASEGRIVILAPHSETVAQIGTRALWLDEGNPTRTPQPNLS